MSPIEDQKIFPMRFILSACLDPSPKQTNLVVGQRIAVLRGRHPHIRIRRCDPVKKWANRIIPLDEDAATQRRLLLIQAKPCLLSPRIWSMTRVASIGENWSDVLIEGRVICSIAYFTQQIRNTENDAEANQTTDHIIQHFHVSAQIFQQLINGTT